MKFLDTDIASLGLGCWPIGGEMYGADGQSLGYSNTDDKESIKAIHAALASGITLFDTAAAYGAGHSERLLAMALASHPEAQVATKIGISINEGTKTLTGDDVEPQSVIPAIERCLERMGRESIDLLLLQPGSYVLTQTCFCMRTGAPEPISVPMYGSFAAFHAPKPPSMCAKGARPASFIRSAIFPERTPDPQCSTMRLPSCEGSAFTLKNAIGISNAPSTCSVMYS